MKNNSKILLTLGAGAVAGAIVGYFLNSDQGRRTRSQAAQSVKSTANDAKMKMNELAASSKAALSNAKGKAKSYADNISQTANETIESAKSSFERGKEATKAKVKSMENSMASNNAQA